MIVVIYLQEREKKRFPYQFFLIWIFTKLTLWKWLASEELFYINLAFMIKFSNVVKQNFNSCRKSQSIS